MTILSLEQVSTCSAVYDDGGRIAEYGTTMLRQQETRRNSDGNTRKIRLYKRIFLWENEGIDNLSCTMSEEQKRLLEKQLWGVANLLRGKMNADEYKNYILGFIFYKYLSEKMELFANVILKQDNIKFREINQRKKVQKKLGEV